MTFYNGLAPWISTGSRVSGDGYGYVILRSEDRSRYAVALSFWGHRRIQEIEPIEGRDSYVLACEFGERFAHVCRQWRTVVFRELALKNGIGVIGG